MRSPPPLRGWECVDIAGCCGDSFVLAPCVPTAGTVGCNIYINNNTTIIKRVKQITKKWGYLGQCRHSMSKRRRVHCRQAKQYILINLHLHITPITNIVEDRGCNSILCLHSVSSKPMKMLLQHSQGRWCPIQHASIGPCSLLISLQQHV